MKTLKRHIPFSITSFLFCARNVQRVFFTVHVAAQSVVQSRCSKNELIFVNKVWQKIIWKKAYLFRKIQNCSQTFFLVEKRIQKYQIHIEVKRVTATLHRKTYKVSLRKCYPKHWKKQLEHVCMFVEREFRFTSRLVSHEDSQVAIVQTPALAHNLLP